MMQPGRELDALIAEKVMGWVVDGDGEIFREAVYLMDLNQWRPSTDIECAWRVVRRMRELGFAPIVMQFIMDEWRVDFGNPFYMSKGESAPMAICCAALMECENRKAA